MRLSSPKASAIIHLCSRCVRTTLLSGIGLALLVAGVNNLTIQAARDTIEREVPAGIGGISRADLPTLRKVETDATRKQRASDDYGRLPLSFVKNEGQTDPRVDFVSRGSGYVMFLSPGGEATLVLSGSTSSAGRDSDPAGLVVGTDPHGARLPPIAENDHPSPSNTGTVLRLQLVGANRKARAEGRQQLPGSVNYLLGKDPQQWRTEIPTFARVAYEGIYPGVDLVYYGNQRQLEYDFIVYPGGNPRAITLEADGADRLEIDNLGDLVLQVGDRQLRHRKPLIYQMVEGVRREIDGRYERDGVRHVKFQLAAYDRTLPLVIDPVLVYSTYLGGNLEVERDDVAAAITVDGAGSAYVTGYTSSTDFPTTGGAFDTTWAADFDVFVTKLDPTGAALVYSTFLGGSGADFGAGVGVDAVGSAYVTGYTYSIDFPTTGGAFDTSSNAGSDLFVTKLDPTGAALGYSTYLGGSGEDYGQAIAVDGLGNAYVTGYTSSIDFPTTGGAFDTTSNAGFDAFVTKLDPVGATPAYSTFLGGSGIDVGQGVTVDATRSAYVTGYTYSKDFPTTGGAFDTTWDAGSEVFLTKLDAAGAALAYSTSLGGGDTDVGQGVAVDAAGSAHVTGYTYSDDFPTTDGAFDTSWDAGSDVFVTKLDAAGRALAYSTYLGSTSEDYGQGIAVDSVGNVYVTGYTSSINFPTTVGAPDTTWNGSDDAFVTKLNPTGAALAYSTFLGGSNTDAGQEIAVDASGSAYVAGYTYSIDFPTTAAAYDTTYAGSADAFVAKIGDVRAPPAALAISPAAATSEVDAQHCVAATVRNASGHPVPDVMARFTVTGAVNTSGAAITDTNGQAAFCYPGSPLPGQDLIRAYADADNSSTQDAEEPAGTATKIWVLPPATPACATATGLGSIPVANSWVAFGFHVRQKPSKPAPQGLLLYYDNATHKYFRATEMTMLIVVGNQATIHGQGQENWGPVVPFRVDVADQPDTFGILWPGYAANGVVRGGIKIVTECDQDNHDDEE